MDRTLTTLKIALRNLVEHRGSSLLIIGSLALALTGNAVIFSMVNAVVHRPFPYREAERLAFLWQADRKVPDDTTPLSPANFLDLKQQSRSFSAIEAFRQASFNLTGGDEPEDTPALIATTGAFRMLGTTAQLGRLFEPGDTKVAVLSDGLWRKRFGADPNLLGRAIQLDEEPYTVVGILPPEFEFLILQVSVWVPLDLSGESQARDQRILFALGRLADGATPEAAKAEMATLGNRLEAAYPEANRGYDVTARMLREQFPGPTDRKIFNLMQGAMLFVLLIACANIANILLARGQDRQREIAVRTALGAGRGRLVGQLVTESLLLSVAGGALALLLARAGIGLLQAQLGAELPKFVQPRLDLPVLGYMALLTLGTGLLFGLLPAWRSSRADLTAVIQDGAKGSTGGRRRQLLARGLVVAEMALALVMLSGTGLLVRAMTQLETLDPGFDSRDVLTLRLAVPSRRYPDAKATATFFAELNQRFAAVPGVTATTASMSLPRSRGNPTANFLLDGQEPPAGPPPVAIALPILPNYFAAMRTTLAAGRAFTSADNEGASPVAIVSQTFVRRHLAEGNPLGRRITVDGTSREIVGIAGDVVQGRLLDQGGADAMIYLPHAQHGSRALYFLLRTAGEQPGLVDTLRREVWALDPAVPVSRIQSLDAHMAQQFAGMRSISSSLGIFGVVALLLAALGLYGVVSYSVAQRTREIGIRMAIGARRERVTREIAGQGLLLAAIGFVLALPGVYLVTLQVMSLGAGILQLAILTVPATGLALLLVATLAAYLPAHRAARLDPIEALRRE